MSNEVARIKAEPVHVSFDDMKQMAVAIANSQLFGLKTPEQALALMLIAQAEGLHPAVAARDYDIIQGRPSKKSEAMLRSFLQAGGKVEWHALDDTIADATFTPPTGGPLRIAWNMERAKKAGLYDKKDSMFLKYPRRMLSARCVSEGIRTVWPLATGGMLAPDEIEAEPVDVTPPASGGVLHRVVAEAAAAKPQIAAAPSPPPSFRDRIAVASTETDLLAIGAEIAKAGMDAEEQKALRDAFRARMEKLKAPVVQASPVPDGWLPGTIPPDVL